MTTSVDQKTIDDNIALTCLDCQKTFKPSQLSLTMDNEETAFCEASGLFHRFEDDNEDNAAPVPSEQVETRLVRSRDWPDITPSEQEVTPERELKSKTLTWVGSQIQRLSKTNDAYCKGKSAGLKSVEVMLRNELETKTRSHAELKERVRVLKGALEGLFEHCAMVHKHWGEGSNQKEADAAIDAARTALSKGEK